jgi:hypothetical protein
MIDVPARLERMAGTTSFPIPAHWRDSGDDWWILLQPRFRGILSVIEMLRQLSKATWAWLR